MPLLSVAVLLLVKLSVTHLRSAAFPMRDQNGDHPAEVQREPCRIGGLEAGLGRACSGIGREKVHDGLEDRGHENLLLKLVHYVSWEKTAALRFGIKHLF